MKFRQSEISQSVSLSQTHKPMHLCQHVIPAASLPGAQPTHNLGTMLAEKVLSRFDPASTYMYTDPHGPVLILGQIPSGAKHSGHLDKLGHCGGFTSSDSGLHLRMQTTLDQSLN